MTGPFFHEALYRGQDALDRLGSARIVLCGAGALGAHLGETLVRQGARSLVAIDMDRVEQRNIGPQIYDESEIGGFKVEALRARCFRATGVEIEAVTKRLTERNVAKLLGAAERTRAGRAPDLVLDTFDNSASRRLVTDHCRARGLACLHLGVNGEYGEARWNEGYRVPGDVLEGDPCAYPLARNLVLFVVALGSEVALRYLLAGERRDYSFTLRDLNINQEPPARP